MRKKGIFYYLFIAEVEELCRLVGYKGIPPANAAFRRINLSRESKDAIGYLHLTFNIFQWGLIMIIAFMKISHADQRVIQFLGTFWLGMMMPVVLSWFILAGCPLTILQKSRAQKVAF